jgi:PAS domain S-box-containing protein
LAHGMGAMSVIRVDCAILDRIGALVLILLPDGRIDHWNEACAELSGYTIEEARGRPVWDFLIPPEEQEGARATIGGLCVAKPKSCSEHYWVTRTGEKRWIAWANVGVFDEQGRLEYIIRTGVDQTANKRAEEAMRASEAILAGLVSIAADAIVSTDEQQRIILFNEGAEEIFGWRREEALGAPLDILLPERSREAHREHVRRFGEGPAKTRRMGLRREIVGLRRNGQKFPADAAISKLDVDGRRVFTAIVRDISERKRIENEQRFLARAGEVLACSLEYEETLTSVAALAVQGMADCCFIDVVENGWIQKVAHRDPAKQELVERLRRLHIDPQQPHLARTALETGESQLVSEAPAGFIESLAQSEEHLAILRELDPRSFIAVPLRARGQVLGVLFLVSSTAGRFSQDDLPLAEELARRAALAVDNACLYRAAQRAIRARDELMGLVAHDLRNPLNAMATSAKVVLRRIGSGPIRRLVQTILRSSGRMDRLIRDLLDVSMIEAGHLPLERSEQDASTLVLEASELLRPTAENASLELVVDLPAELSAVYADRERVLQVFSNLIDNAAKFTQAGGRIRVAAERRGADVLFTVSDTGRGIPPEDLPHVFDRYWQARRACRSGTGLGLAIAKGIVEAHGGRIWVASTAGAGTTFYFTLPARPNAGDQAATWPGLA